MIFGLWISSIVMSFSMDFIQGSRMYKDAADNGYNIKTTKLSECLKQFSGYDELMKKSFINYLIPGYNIFCILDKTIKYNENRDEVFNFLSTTDSLREMSDKEKEEYSKKPTLFNALKLSFKAEINESLNEKSLLNSDKEDNYDKMVNVSFDKAVEEKTDELYEEEKLSKEELIALRNSVLEVKEKQSSDCNQNKDNNEEQIEKPIIRTMKKK